MKVRDEFFFTQGLGMITHLNICSSSPCHCSAIDETHLKLKNTMLAVVQLHKPRQSLFNDLECNECTGDEEITLSIAYPCPTIQAIEKELNG